MKLLITSLLAFFCCTASYSQTKASEFTHLDIIDKQVIPEDTAIRKGVLDNGLTYYVRKSTFNKYVNFNLLAKGGSVIEEDNDDYYNYSIINDYIKRELGEIVEKDGDTSYIKKVTPASLKAHLKRLLKKGNLHIGYLTSE